MTDIPTSDKTVTFTFTECKDGDNNYYPVVQIGTQLWMAENLKTTKYNDGTAIPNITDNTAWAALNTGAYSDYNNTPANSTIYGRLYNWFAVDNNAATKVASNGGKNVCPISWHVSSDAEWSNLLISIGAKLTKPVLLPYRVASVTTLVITTSLEVRVSGGLMMGQLPLSLGHGSCLALPPYSMGATIRWMAYLFVVSGIRTSSIFDNLDYPANRGRIFAKSEGRVELAHNSKETLTRLINSTEQI
jgi:uncharacterized protein (TIGR02145 family)